MPLHDPLPSHPLMAAVSLLLYSNLPPLEALAPLLAGETSVHSVFHPRTYCTVGNFLALCPPTLLAMSCSWASGPSLSNNLSGVNGLHADL